MNNARQIFITIDLDWAPEPVLEDMAALLQSSGIPVTIFATHPSETISRMSASPSVEIGIHPNFNPCLERGDATADATNILTEARNLAPRATAIRSHSLMQSSRLLALFRDHSLTHEVNTFVPFDRCMGLKAWRHPVGITSVPFLWEDDFACMTVPFPLSPLPALDGPGIKVFNFHPVHLYLNTVRLSDYEIAKKSGFSMATMNAVRKAAGSTGIRDYFQSLIFHAKQRQFAFGLISRIQTA